ncbi:hypothetical protein BD311DRAFT_111467 [Dichomitus squalens]|uniref:Uncharacterized protein n=1 Tax=Dichomitus squalens TaxID=114155 RepID=A0A4Q9M7F9_9APHY|nr:hypothetical protein BD311DRAFT_111467 [Dichomitus squalens]
MRSGAGVSRTLFGETSLNRLRPIFKTISCGLPQILLLVTGVLIYVIWSVAPVVQTNALLKHAVILPLVILVAAWLPAAVDTYMYARTTTTTDFNFAVSAYCNSRSRAPHEVSTS